MTKHLNATILTIDLFLYTPMNRKRLHRIIFKTDTKAGILFDEILLVLVFLSVIIVMLRSVWSIEKTYTWYLVISQWIITILFSIEYILRIRVSKEPKKFIFSFFGIIDFLAILPSFLSFMVAWHSLMMLRALRLLRLFRVFKLWRYTSASSLLRNSLKASRAKITVFLLTVFIIVLIVWTLMYLIEWDAAGFDSIPIWVYWAIVTITTVWYGDITPLTPIGQLLSATLMILWYGIIAVPTWLVSAELIEQKHNLEKPSSSLDKKHKKKK